MEGPSLPGMDDSLDASVNDAELISARAAAALLGEGPCLPRSQAGRVLASGLAGRPTRDGRRQLFRAAAVRELAGRPIIEDAELRRLHLPVLAIARRQVDVLEPLDSVLAGLAEGWDLHAAQCVGITARVERTGPIPFVVTVAGFVQVGAELTGAFSWAKRGDVTLGLRPPGRWYDRVRRLRLMTGPGRPFTIRDWHAPWELSVA